MDDNRSDRRGGWLLWGILLTLVEKFIGSLSFAIFNFTIPFSLHWLALVFRALPGLLVMDLLYGRIVLFSVSSAVLGRCWPSRPLIPPVLFFSSFMCSLIIIIFSTGDAEMILLSGRKPWNAPVFYLIVVSLAIAFVWGILRARRSRVRSGKISET